MSAATDRFSGSRANIFLISFFFLPIIFGVGCLQIKPEGPSTLDDIQVHKEESNNDPVPLNKLREDLAMNFLDATPHLFLARHYYEKGDRLLAFYISEYARRRFGDLRFDPAFHRVFRTPKDFDNSDEAEAILLNVYRRDRNSIEVVNKLANIYASRKNWPKAREYMNKVIELKPDDFGFHLALAETYKREDNREKADEVVKNYLERYPQSNPAYQFKTGKLMETDRRLAKQFLTEAIERYPKEGVFHFNLGVILQEEENLADAEKAFVKASEMAPGDAHVQGWVGRFFLKVRKQPEKSLGYYLDAYFLDPHFYDSEFAESRIRKLNWEISESKFNKLLQSGVPLGETLMDENPVVVGRALEKISKVWDKKYTKALIGIMEHDDPTLRWRATEILMNHVDNTFEEELRTLLSDPDFRKRGLSAYIAVRLLGRNSFDEIESFLYEKPQLLRYDAISALIQQGGEEGRHIVLEYREKETDPALQEILASVL